MYQVDPVVDADGNYQGSSIGTRPQLHRGSVDAPSDYYEDEYGQTHHLMEDVEIEDDTDPNEFSDDAYIALLYDVHPELTEAVAWSHQNLTNDEATWYNQMIDSEDLDDVNAAVEFLLAKYATEAEVVTDEEEDVSEEQTEEDEEELEVPSLESLYEQEPDVDTAMEHAQLAQDTEGVESLLWSLSASFFNGDLTQDEAIEAALSSGYSRNELIEMYNLLSSQNEH